MGHRYVVFRSDAKGRTVIPATLRAQAGIKEQGDTLVGYVEEGRLVVQTRATIKQRLRAQAEATGAKDVVERLLADRRADRDLEAQKDQERARSARRRR
jgi:bifunctional DNA-binding transcriptional regulator/antitoxin component of YhaV-PrlF toxin-antitoxin module